MLVRPKCSHSPLRRMGENAEKENLNQASRKRRTRLIVYRKLKKNCAPFFLFVTLSLNTQNSQRFCFGSRLLFSEGHWPHRESHSQNFRLSGVYTHRKKIIPECMNEKLVESMISKNISQKAFGLFDRFFFFAVIGIELGV